VLDCFDDLDHAVVQHLFEVNKNTGIPYNINAKNLGHKIRRLKANQHELLPVAAVWEGLFERVTDAVQRKRMLALVHHQRISVNQIWFNKIQLRPDLPKGYNADTPPLPLGHTGGTHPLTKEVYSPEGPSSKFHELSKKNFFDSLNGGHLNKTVYSQKMHALFEKYFENVPGFNVLDDVTRTFDDNLAAWETFCASKGW
jgi:hypothetical protein